MMSSIFKFSRQGSSNNGSSQPDSQSESSRSGETPSSTRRDQSRVVSTQSRYTVGTDGFIVARNDVSKLGTTVRQVLENPELSRRFKEFAATLHADEGLLFLDDLKAAHEHPDQVAAADTIMRKYFLDDAENWVNLPDGIRTELLEKYRTGSYANVEELFNDTTYEVFTDLKKSDTFRNFLLQDEEAKRVATDEARLLDIWLTSENFRDALQAVSDDPTLANIVRFCSSVSDYEREDDKTARKARGNKIAVTFVQMGATFQIALPKYYEDAILKGKFQLLSDARTELLQTLSKHEKLMETVRKGLTTFHQTASPRESNVSSCVVELQNLMAKGEGKALVQRLLELKTENTAILNKARFCSAVAGFLAMPGSCDGNSAKLGLARKIATTYVQKGSLYQVEVAPGFVDDICDSKTPNYVGLYSVLYQQFLSDLGLWAPMEPILNSLNA